MKKKKREYYHLVILDLGEEVDRVRGLTKHQAEKIEKHLNGWADTTVSVEKAPPRPKKPKDHKDQLDLYTQKKVD